MGAPTIIHEPCAAHPLGCLQEDFDVYRLCILVCVIVSVSVFVSVFVMYYTEHLSCHYMKHSVITSTFIVVMACYNNVHLLTILGAQLLVIILCTMGGLISVLHHILHSQTNWHGNYCSCRYRGFLRDCPTGFLTEQVILLSNLHMCLINAYIMQEFCNIYKQYFPFGDPTQFASLVFHMFDSNNDGGIEFKEFITALSVTSRGTIKEKLEC